MENVLGYIGYAVVAPFHLTHVARKSLAERTTNKYLQTLSDTSLLSGLNDALEPLLHDLGHFEQIFDKFAVRTTDRKSVWNEQCFFHFINATYGGAQVIGALIPLQWQCFCSAAYFPLNAPAASRLSSTGMELDLRTFRRAFALLVLQGIELLGFKQDRAQLDHKYQYKVPRIARFIISCATKRVASTASQPKEGFQETAEDLTVENVSDVIFFAQPQTYGHYPDGPRVPQEHFQGATQRIIALARSQPTYTPVAPEIRKVDLQALLQLSLLVSLQDRRWRNGLEMPIGMGFTTQRSADIQHSRLILCSDAVSQASELAASLLAHNFNSEGESIPYTTFEQYLSECPAFILLIFQIWTSIFSPAPRSHETTPKSHPPMPISISNSLTLLNVAKFLNVDQPRARYFQNELQLNVDMQASSLVSDTIESSSRTRAAIETALTTGSHFHVVLVRGQNVDVAPSNNDNKNKDQLLAIFIAPQDPKMQIWRARDAERSHVEYVWRSSFVQLLPEVIRADAGPMSIVDGEAQEGCELMLKAQGGERSDGAHVPSIRLDMANSRLIASDLGNGGGAMTVRWTSLRCYRMPGTACPVTYGP